MQTVQSSTSSQSSVPDPAVCMSEKSTLVWGRGTTPGSLHTAFKCDIISSSTIVLKTTTLNGPHKLKPIKFHLSVIEHLFSVLIHVLFRFFCFLFCFVVLLFCCFTYLAWCAKWSTARQHNLHKTPRHKSRWCRLSHRDHEQRSWFFTSYRVIIFWWTRPRHYSSQTHQSNACASKIIVRH